MDYTKFSCTFTVRRLLRDDIPSIFALCEKNPQFYEHCPPFVTPEKIEADMKAMPQRKAGQEQVSIIWAILTSTSGLWL